MTPSINIFQARKKIPTSTLAHACLTMLLCGDFSWSLDTALVACGLVLVIVWVPQLNLCIGPSVDDQAVSLSDDGTTIIIDFFSSFLFSLSFFLSFYRHSTRHTLHLHFNPD